MSDDREPAADTPSPREIARMLQRTLAAVEKDHNKGWADIACAVVLSLATTCSAWCAYQSARWSGVQMFRLADSARAGRESSVASVAAIQIRSFDASMFISYMEAKHSANDLQEKFLYERLRPEMKKAVDAWLLTDPFHAPSAPPSPFSMPEYSLKELAAADRQNALSDQSRAGAEAANMTSDEYVLLTVVFASVLFFGGIGGALRSNRARDASVALSWLIFIATVIALGTMPMCPGLPL